MDERWTRRYARWAFALRWPLLAFVLLLTLLAATRIPELRILNDPDTLLPPSNRYVATNLYAEHKFGMGNLMVVGLKIKEGEIYQPWFINTVQEIHNRLQALPHARPANFLSLAAQKVKYMGADANGLVFRRLIPTTGIDPKDEAVARQQLDFLKEGLEGNPVMAPMLLHRVDEQGRPCTAAPCLTRATFVIADFDDGVKESYLTWVRQLLAALEPYSQDARFDLYIAGEPYFLAYMLLELVNHWWLFVISLVIVVAILFKEFGSVRYALFSLMGVGATIVWTLGAMAVSQFRLTTMMVLTPMLLLAIGIGHAIQITRRTMREMGEGTGEDPREAGLSALEHTLIPALLSIVTDAAGFATLALVDISFYKDYAYFGMLGMFSLLLTTTTMIPLLITLFPKKRVAEDLGWPWEERMGALLSDFLGSRHGPLTTVAGTLLLLGVSAHFTGIFHATADDLMPGVEKGINYASAAFKKESITIRHIEELGRIMPGVISLNIPIRGKAPIRPQCDELPEPAEPPACHDVDTMGSQGIFNDAEVLSDLAEMEKWMRKHPYIGFTGSYAQYVRLVNMLLFADPGAKPDLRHFEIPTKAFLHAIDPGDDRNPNEIVSLYNGLLKAMTSGGDLDSFVNAQNWNEGVLLGFVNTMDPVKTHQVVLDIQEYIEAHKNDPGFAKVHFGLRNADTSGDSGPLSQPGPDYLAPGIGGFLGATEATREVSFANWLVSPLQTAAAIFAITALIFRSLLVPGILMIILGITLFSQYGMAGYFSSVANWAGNLHFGNLVALSIAMGLGVDYSLYMIARLQEEMARGGEWREALRRTLSTCGSAVVISVVVLLGSLVPLTATELGNTWGLGVYIGEALIVDLFTALTLLPLLVLFLKPNYVFRKNTP